MAPTSILWTFRRIPQTVHVAVGLCSVDPRQLSDSFAPLQTFAFVEITLGRITKTRLVTLFVRVRVVVLLVPGDAHDGVHHQRIAVEVVDRLP